MTEKKVDTRGEEWIWLFFAFILHMGSSIYVMLPHIYDVFDRIARTLP